MSRLRLSLVSLKHALLPPDKRFEDYVPRNDQVDALSFDQLMDDIRGLATGK